MTTFQSGQQAYTSASGTTITSNLVIFQRDPTVNDVTYKIGNFWLNTIDESLWILDTLSSSNATLQANWIEFQNHIGTTETLTGNSGGAVSPDIANNINTLGTGSITIIGDPGTNTTTTQLTGLTDHNVLVGAGTATITNVSPSTSGFVLTSNGATVDPSFQSVSSSGAITTITGNDGTPQSPLNGNFDIIGTGSIITVGAPHTEVIQLTGLTAHNVLIGAGTPTITSVSPSTAGFVLTSNGASADPSFQNSAAVSTFNVQVFTTTGTYTPTAGLNYCTIEVLGGGGGGGGVAAAAGGQSSVGSGGGGGGYSRKTVSAATIGASQSVTIGAGGTAGASGGGSGGTGGTTSVGATILQATGGVGGSDSGSATMNNPAGGAGGVGSLGDVNITGGAGVNAFGYIALAMGGTGGSSVLGGGGAAGSANNAGSIGGNYGGGGGGGSSQNGGAQAAGGAGAQGIVIITEYIA